MALHTTRASEFSLAQLAVLLNAGYENYMFPVAFDATSLARRVVADHIDLAASHVLLAPDDTPSGVMLIARRGAKSRVAALGIALPHRGGGIGQRAIRLAQAEARQRRDSQLFLEVIKSNSAALHTYQKCGFTRLRSLVGYAAQPADHRPLPDDYVLCDVAEAAEMLGHFLPAGLPWQIAPPSLASLVLPAQGIRSVDSRAAAIFDASGRAPRLLSFGVHPQSRSTGLGSELIEGLTASVPGAWQISALVPNDLVDGFLLRLGWKRSIIDQYEMVWVP